MTATFNKLRNRSAALLKRPTPREIFYVNFAITYRCNSACKMCNIWKYYQKEPDKLSEELSLEEIMELFNSSSFLKNIRSIHLTGGEPFLRDDFVNLIGFFVNKYPRAVIFIPTNSLNPQLILRKFEEIQVKFALNQEMIHLGFSIDGIGKSHNNQRGKKNAFHSVLEGIAEVRRRLPEISLNVSFTITPDNYMELLEVYKLSQKIGVDFGTQFAQLSGTFYRNADKSLLLSIKQLDEIQRAIKIIYKDKTNKLSLKNKMIDIAGIYLSKMVEFQRKPRRLFHCFSGIHSFFLDPYGSVFPCIMSENKLGNIRENKFDDIWFSEKALHTRDDIESEKCWCWAACEVIPSLQRDFMVLVRNDMHFIKRVIDERFSKKN